MNPFLQALWAEMLKARRAKITWLAAAATLLLPLVDGLFMVILKDPVQAQSMGRLGRSFGIQRLLLMGCTRLPLPW